ncbi:hypothetical protein D9M68_968520 [compost metagenome]
MQKEVTSLKEDPGHDLIHQKMFEKTGAGGFFVIKDVFPAFHPETSVVLPVEREAFCMGTHPRGKVKAGHVFFLPHTQRRRKRAE